MGLTLEQLADLFAGRLLMPRDHFIERLRLMVGPGRTADHTDLIAVARYFGVSVQAGFVQLDVLRLASCGLAMSGHGGSGNRRLSTGELALAGVR